ncbi:helix-turn-helix domain-containing protein [Sphingopyxis sp.]|uniref:helix-turn-helix domain-containing protein n=1 Tax=Sphingopyxis sp. TaxID=1908224 RepID=UPI003F71FFC8
MRSANALWFGDSWAIYRGDAPDQEGHIHAAIQIVFADAGTLEILSADLSASAGPGFAIRPLVEHHVRAAGPVTLLYIEPQSPLAFIVADACGDGDIAAIDPAALGYTAGQDLADWNRHLAEIAGRSDRAIDTRLRAALLFLAEEPGSRTIAEAAAHCGLSESHLRLLTRCELGLPLSTWLIWRKLEGAARALQDDESLAAAALIGGFADQAHLTRAMRRMFGITPRSARRAVRPDRPDPV